MIEIQYPGERKIKCIGGNLDSEMETAKMFAWLHGFCDVMIDGKNYATYFRIGTKVRCRYH